MAAVIPDTGVLPYEISYPTQCPELSLIAMCPGTLKQCLLCRAPLLIVHTPRAPVRLDTVAAVLGRQSGQSVAYASVPPSPGAVD